jgi:23S rRNA pseudouridine2605 synthase
MPQVARGGRRPREPGAASAAEPQQDPVGVDFKLQKLLAEAGLGSRRDMEEAIASGRVSVNSKIAGIGTRVTRRDVVRVDGKQVKLRTGRETPEVLLYHKPPGEIVSHDDPEGRVSVFSQVPPPQSGKWLAVGRLDYNTEGLLILTNSGDLANRLMHPRYEVEREYSVRVIGELNDEQTDNLLDGIELDDGPARFMKLEEGEFSDEGTGINRWYRVMIREGRNREVRRMFEAVGVTVSRLIRTRFGPISLPRMLGRGQSRPATPDEIKELLRGAPAASAGAEVAAPRRSPAGPKSIDGNVGAKRARKRTGSVRPPIGAVAPSNAEQGQGARRRRGKGRLSGGRGAGAPASVPSDRPGRGRGPMSKKAGRGARGKIDPGSMTLDGRRAGRGLRREEERAPPPKKMPVIIHRRSKLKIMPEPDGGGANE